MFAETLKSLRKARGLTQKQLADLLYIDCSTVTKWETKKSNPDFEKQQQLAELFGVSLDLLMGREKSSRNTNIPVLGSIPAGIPFEAIEDVIGEEEIPAEWTLGGKEFFALKIKGDSMYPEYRTGDIVIFKKQEDCESGDDCAVMVNGYDATFKRVEKLEGGGILLKPLNPNYPTSHYTDQDIVDLPIKILGIAWELRRSRR